MQILLHFVSNKGKKTFHDYFITELFEKNPRRVRNGETPGFTPKFYKSNLVTE